MKERIHIIVGHYGSGKTEFALNYAMKLKESGEKVTIADLDIVNPYFRTNDAKALLEQSGISVLASGYAGTNVDIPSLPADIARLFDDKTSAAILDVGGDEDGAIVLGRFREQIISEGYEMLFVVNSFRPLTKDADSLIEILKEVEAASRLSVTGLVNNANLQGLTTAAELSAGQKVCEEAAERLGIPVSYISGVDSVLADFAEPDAKGERFPLVRYLDLGYQL